MNFFERLIGTFFEPEKTFQDVNRKGAWLGVFLLVAILMSGALFAAATRVDQETYMRASLQQNPMTKNMPEEQVQKIVEQSSPRQRYIGPAFTPVGMIIAYLALAGVFLLVFVIMGVSLTFKKSLAVTIWAMAPPTIVVTILGIIFIFVKDPDTLELFDVTKNVASNLGVLVAKKEQPVLHSLLSSIDLFSFWTIFLLAVGFSTVSNQKLTKGKAAMVFVMLWGAYVLAKLGWVAMVG
jgi:hypothetical protein